jgi:predicted Fe-Mo cluster-binding NifX family protein
MIKVINEQLESEIIEDVDVYVRELKRDDNIVYAVNIVCDNDIDVLTASSIGEDMIRCFKEKGLHLIVFLGCEHMKYEFYELKKE